MIDKLTKELIKAGVNSIAWQGADGDFPKMAVLINFSLCYIGNDTGPMHVAAACNIPVVAIFGGGNWPRFLPNCSTGLVFVYYCECFGCSWDCHVEDYPYCLGRVNKRKVYSKLLTFFNNLEGNPAFEVIYDRPRESDVNVILQLTRKSFLTQQEDREARLKVILEQQDELRTLRQYVDELNADREARLKLLLESRSELSELNNKLSVREAKIVDFAYTIEKQEVALATLRKEVDAVNLDRKVRLNLILDQQALLIRLKQKLTDLGDEIEKNLAELEKH